MKKRLLFSLLAVLVFIIRYISKNPSSCCRLDASLVEPGDLLFSPIGKKESFYIGHVGIVTGDNHVVHSVPAGIIRDPLPYYLQKFRGIERYKPKQKDAGLRAAQYIDTHYPNHTPADYTIITTLGSRSHQQYCSKIVWQAYYYGAGINLGRQPKLAVAVHPQVLKDSRYFLRMERLT
ncbi:hypothetical protein M662_09855 [Bacillus sp. SB49]|uniref:YiiX/YebB-like N1pC/P60 family cysteine hydrolase n=1 Tax=Bacillus sp. SB49 TaxID=1071080 RepID=UPI00047E5027|nr:YiiX/YebB-like N1pC/P60 family cysteine hydrolase [Bacillus sp. SB49]QHT46782.1 hypothetical protein M662_09855 [Bacillus sp. SB49]